MVTTARSGRATAAIFGISPGSLIPISKTAASAAKSASQMEIGTPNWPLLLPLVPVTFRPAESAAVTISLVVVFPTLPVMPITGILRRFRYAAPSAWSAFTVSST